MRAGGTCRTCGALIMWRRTVNEKFVPVDSEPHANGVLADDGEVVRVVKVGSAPRLYHSHFVTCKDAAQHRKPRAAVKPTRCSVCGEGLEMCVMRCHGCGAVACGHSCAVEHAHGCTQRGGL